MHKKIDQSEQRKEMHRLIDQRRDETEQRKEMHRLIDETEQRKEKHRLIDHQRDQTEPRKKMHRSIDHSRDKTEERKEMHRQIDKLRNMNETRKIKLAQYEQTETRRRYVYQRNNVHYRKKLLEIFTTDTGFDVICLSCMEFKSLRYCKSIFKLDEEKRQKFLIDNRTLAKTKYGEHFICNICFQDIAKDIRPKKGCRDTIRFENFPKSFIETIIRKCRISRTDDMISYDPCYDLDSCKLNRLESYLLKLIIPFVRIAHCPRSHYFKVKGDLILIASDISHSLSKVLPRNQSLIPVSFKRKLSYSGSYIEEYVEKEKVQLYFAWLKRYNHLFKNVSFDLDLIEDFITESKSSSEVFPDSSFMEQEIIPERDIPYEDNESAEINCLDPSVVMNEHPFEDYPLYDHETDKENQIKTSMFMNKYCEELNNPTVVNRLSDIIVEFETASKIPVSHDSDFEVDDEIVNEEEYHKLMEEDDNRNINKDIVEHAADIDLILKERLDNDISLSKQADLQVKKVMKNLDKISVAPGEFGSFQNWGEDTYIEEKAFPALFPYGVGGYLSSCITNPESMTGFASYCVSRIMSANPKFRNDMSYLFFLLLVKELIELKRCRQTYF